MRDPRRPLRWTILATTVLAGTYTAADPASPGALEKCVKIDAPAERLACYDQFAGRMPISASAPVKSAAATKEAFGLYSAEHPAPPPSAQTIVAKVVSVGTNANGYTTITLEGGQVWQLDTSDPVIDRGDSVTIRRAALGSFLMTTPGGRTDRLHRLR